MTLKEGRALEGVMLLFSSTTLGTCTNYGYVVKKSKGPARSDEVRKVQVRQNQARPNEVRQGPTRTDKARGV